jgi:hypothetical protein
MARPRKQINQQIRQQADVDVESTDKEMEPVVEDTDAPDLAPLLDQLQILAGKTQFYADHGHAPWLQNQLLSLIAQLKASL